jgi:THO complex subunit 1
MSIDDLPPMVTCRDLVLSHVQRLLQNRLKTGSDAPISDSECAELVQQLQATSQDDSRELSRSRIDAIFRDRFANVVATTDISDPAFQEAWLIIDIATIMTDHQCSEPALNFYLIEELLDSQGIEGCKRVFDYLEPRMDRMIASYPREKGLVILRCSNELLRRLSRAEDTVFCGRVFIYMFQCFPLGEKSSVNLRGFFHTDNITTFDASPNKSEDAIKPMEIDTEPAPPASDAQTPASNAPDSDTISKTGRSTPLPRTSKQEPKAAEEPPPDLDTLYPKFWSLQQIFCSPTRLFETPVMTEFRENIALTLSCFKSISTSTSSSATTGPKPTTGAKRKHSEISNTTTPFNSKYLTNRDLFDLEIHDLAFRRHILVQSLIMLDFLLSLTPTAKSKVDDLVNMAVQPKTDGETEEERDKKVQPNRPVLFTYTISPDDEKWCATTRAQICSYLQSQGSGNEGRMYTRMVETVLSRDKNWVRWKNESCPLIKRNPLDANTYVEAQKTLLDIAKSANRHMPTPMGASDFSFLNEKSSMEDLKCPSQRFKVPSLQQYYDQAMNDELDLEMASDDAEKRDIEERKAGKVWRAMRASVLEGRRVGLCEKLRKVDEKESAVNGDAKKEPVFGEVWNLKALIGEEDEVKEEGANGDEPDAAATPMAGTPLPGSDAPEQTEQEGAAQPPPSPKPEHIADAPTAEEATPTPTVNLDGTMEDSTLPDATAPAEGEPLQSGEVEAGATETVVAEIVASIDPEESIAEVEEGAVEDEEMGDFAPGDIDD